MTNPCFVLGNGPSLRGFDFKGLGDCASLGMNAAYRYWDEIDWYPTYFACLDDQLIITHHDEFYRLWKEGRFKALFLHGSFFDYHPDCICAAGMYSLDQVLPHWYGKRGQQQGWENLVDNPAFWTEDTTKVTTGAWATRFAAFMGHDLIALGGIDLQYVEVLPEAEVTSGIGLVMTETPKHNPNYFFDSYQRAGDKFNVPNPAVHDNALHIQSFQLVRSDFDKVNPSVQVVNTNPRSQLESDRVFPLRAVSDVLNPAAMGAVVVPATSHEIAAILANFDIWAHADYAPVRPDQTPGLCTLHFVFNNNEASGYEPLIRQVFSETGMERYFSHVRFSYLNLTGALDKYERDYAKSVGAEGYKSGPNNQFFGTLAAARDDGASVFQMETDCVPLRAGWLRALQDLVAAQDPFWVMGSRYLGVETLSPDFENHINGNALYAVGDPAFQDFVNSFWEPRTKAMVAETDKRLAYDCILETVFTTQKDSDPEVATLLHEKGHLFCDTPYVLNISGKRDLSELSQTYAADLMKKYPAAFVLHNRSAQQRVATDVGSSRPVPQMSTPAQAILKPATRPAKLLVIDMTVMGNGSATGEIKANLLREWPDDALLQIACPTGDAFTTVRRGADGEYITTPGDPAAMKAAIAAFNPEVILYRPLPDRPALHQFAMALITESDLPLVTWIMDDWPARLYASDRDAFHLIDQDLKLLLKKSALRLSISAAMSVAFAERYGAEFIPFANGIDPALWTKPKTHQAGPVVLRYAGGLAPDMNAASVQRVAQAVQALADTGRDIRFEINTQSWWLEQAAALFKGLPATVITAQKRSFSDYAAWLCSADILLVAYNFDEPSLRYVRYSMANKIPECFASGAAILAHGPSGVATVDYLAQTDTAKVVDMPTTAALQKALGDLMQPSMRQTMAAKARRLVHERHNLTTLGKDLVALFDQARKPAAKMFPRLYLASAPGQPLEQITDTVVARTLLAEGAQGVLIYDDPVAALAASLHAAPAPEALLADWEKHMMVFLPVYRKFRSQITVIQRRSDAAPDLVNIAALSPAAEPLDVPLQAVDPVLRVFGQTALDGHLGVANIVQELAASSHPWEGAQSGDHDNVDADMAAAVTYYLQHKQVAGPTPVTSSNEQQLKALLAQSQNELNQIYASKSWRMTGKLRGLRRRLGRVKRRLQRSA